MKSIIEEPDLPIMFLWGGRGTGKTYGALEQAELHYRATGERFIYLRRTNTQLDECMRAENNPFKTLNKNNNWSIYPTKERDFGRAFYECDVDYSGKLSIKGLPHGYMLSLSTIGNIRGLSYDDVALVIYDEFMKMPMEKTMKGEGRAFADMYESINRNREFTGEKPLKVVCLSNANDLANDLFVYYSLVDRVEFMLKNNKMQYLDYGRGLALLRFDDSEISKKKANTALYRFTGKDSEYTKFALANAFAETDIPTIKTQNLLEYKPLVTINNLTIYEHKSNRIYYATFHKSGTVETFSNSEIDRKRFCRKYMFLWTAHLNEKIFFETYEIYRIFEKIFD